MTQKQYDEEYQIRFKQLLSLKKEGKKDTRQYRRVLAEIRKIIHNGRFPFGEKGLMGFHLT